MTVVNKTSQPLSMEIVRVAQPTDIGTLKKLAPEVRILIWEHFSTRKGDTQQPGDDDPAPKANGDGSLGILRTCRRLYDEVIPYLYRNEALTFTISPVVEGPPWTITNRLGVEWRVNRKDALALGFGDLPYEKLQEVNIEIPPPGVSENQEKAKIWLRFHRLVEFFAKTSKPSKIKITLKGNEKEPWFKDGEHSKSVQKSRYEDLYHNGCKQTYFAILEGSCELLHIKRSSDVPVIGGVPDGCDCAVYLGLVDLHDRSRSYIDSNHGRSEYIATLERIAKVLDGKAELPGKEVDE